jgi:hypothetical protein
VGTNPEMVAYYPKIAALAAFEGVVSNHHA